MHWTKQIIALKAQSRTLQIFDLGEKKKLKSATMNEEVVFWKWFSETTLGLVTETTVYHWDVFDPNQASPVEVFKRNPNLVVSVCAFKHQLQLLTLRIGLPDYQLSCQRRWEVDGCNWYITTTRTCGWSNAIILERSWH